MQPRPALSAPLATCCAHLERGELVAARVALESTGAEMKESAEWLVLDAWVERRTRAPHEGWLDSLLEAWRAAGTPTHFESLRHKGTFEDLEEEPAPASPLWALLMLNQEPAQADSMARQALAHLPFTGQTVDALWLCELLGSSFLSPEVASEARPARQHLLTALAERHPEEFLLVADALLGREAASDAPLMPQQVHALHSGLRRGPGRLDLGSLYRQLVHSREARTSSEREACFIDALMLLPAPLVRLYTRAVATFAAGVGKHRDALVHLLREVGRVFSGRGALAERGIALSLLHEAAVAAGDHGALRDIEEQRAMITRIAFEGRRLSLDWPVEGLRREAMDAAAEDEWGLMLRTAFPPESLG